MEYTGIAGSGCVFARSPAAAMDDSLNISCDSCSCPTHKHFFYSLAAHQHNLVDRLSIVWTFSNEEDTFVYLPQNGNPQCCQYSIR